ncbi:MAG: FCD domain-containing protein [Acetobacteraceae bacterium]|nr:FCD domain-containing protein [Acetobacteraceae bacterium]
MAHQRRRPPAGATVLSAFHLALFRIAKLHALEPILQRCILHTHRFKLWAPWHQRPLAHTAARHAPILAALSGGDGAALNREITRHLDTIVEYRPESRNIALQKSALVNFETAPILEDI